MSFILKKFTLTTALLALLTLTGCGDKSPTAQTTSQNPIKVGVMMSADLAIPEAVKKVAKERYGLDIELVLFNDFVMPNEALNRGDIDINAFQHKPFLDEQIKTRGYKLVPVAHTFVYPIAAYSNKITSVDEIKNGDTVAIPNDPTNLGRALLLLEQQGLIKLKTNEGFTPTVFDIVENPKQLNIIELEAPQLPRSLDDRQVTLAVINTVYALQIGLSPTKNGLFAEDKNSPYVNLIVVREDNKDAEYVKTFIKAYQSDEVYQAAYKEFKGDVIKGW